MAIEETGSYIGDWSTTASANKPTDNPGKRSDGAAEIRQLKKIIFDTFPEADGAINVSDTEFNYLAGVTSAIQTQINQGGFTTGTAMVFYQNTAPTGWTIVSAVDEHAIRLTKGSTAGGQAGGATGGTNNFSTQFANLAESATPGVGDHTLTITEIPAHTHNYSLAPANRQGASAGSSRVEQPSSPGDATTSAGGGGAHSHTIDLRVKWAACIIADKN